MKFSSLCQRIAPSNTADGEDAWEVHNKAVALGENGRDIIFLSIGQEADEVTPDIIVNKAISSLQAGRHHYTDVKGEPMLREAVATYHTQLTGQSVKAQQCAMFNGAQNALFSVAQILLETGDEVILSEPWYTTYAATFSATGATLVSVPVTRENNFQLDPAAIIAHINDRTRAVVLNTPNNPMGSCYTKAELNDIVAACTSNGIWLILDTVYADIVDPQALFMPHKLNNAPDVVITIGSLSKSHRMTGWRVGWAIGPQTVADQLANLSMCMHYGLPPFIMDAAVTALQESTGTPAIVKNQLDRRRALVHKHLIEQFDADSKISVIDSGQGMFILLDVAALDITARMFALGLLEASGVAVLPCDGFGPSGRSLVRLGLCVDDNRLVLACEHMLNYIKQLG